MFDNVFPGFVLEAISGYVRTKSYSIGNMEEREREIKTKAEEVVNQTLSFPKRIIFNWLLFHARRGTDYASTCVCHDNTEILRGISIFKFANQSQIAHNYCPAKIEHMYVLKNGNKN